MPVVTEAKSLEEALEEAKNQLKTGKIVYKKEEKVSGKLFKSKEVSVTAITYEELLDEIKIYLKEVIENMGLTVNFETSIDNFIFEIKMYSDNNAILIGKNGQTLKALETLVRAKTSIAWGFVPKVVLDVENYNEKRIEFLEKLAVRTAVEVRNTKVSAILEDMNSYERRIIHSRLADFKGISTISEGEEPNRHIVIKAE